LTLARFATLDALYASDLARLEAIEEGALVLVALTVQSCAVCGAPPESQVHRQGKEEIAQYQRAAESEARKITQERRDLGLTIASLSAEAEGLLKRLKLLGKDLLIIEAELEQTLPLEAGIRRDYELNSLKRTELTHQLDLHEQLEVLEQKRAQLTAPQQKKKKGDKLEIGLDTNTAFKFAQTVKDVLTEWHFPDAENVQFDAEKQDIQLNGKARAANGKGVRALLHAAFKVAVLIFCRKHRLPHPGIVVLDTPLLTYREPLENAKYGELEADELAIKGTGLAQHFYEHLTSLRTIGQIIILENTDPPPLATELANIQVFVGNGKGGRAGFFPYPVQP
jgi:hypothetical protein